MGVLGLVGVVNGLSPINPGWRICGPAVTMRQVAVQDPLSWDPAATDISGVRSCAQPGDVIVVDAGGRLDVSTYGGGSAGRLKEFGIEGVVIDGASRDSLELLDIDSPTFSRGISLVHPRGFMTTTSINTEPVQIGSTPGIATVYPGDVICADRDGLVVVPRARLGDLLRQLAM
jgi:regulator of RNase E activity RraA